MKKITSLIVLVFLVASTVEAKYVQTCVAQYMTRDGWSKKYTVDTTFISGYELNEATSSYRYSSYSVYAVIFWGEGQASVIKVSNYLACGTTVDRDCIANTYGDIRGRDQDGDEWKICTGSYCQ